MPLLAERVKFICERSVAKGEKLKVKFTLSNERLYESLVQV